MLFFKSLIILSKNCLDYVVKAIFDTHGGVSVAIVGASEDGVILSLDTDSVVVEGYITSNIVCWDCILLFFS